MYLRLDPWLGSRLDDKKYDVITAKVLIAMLCGGMVDQFCNPDPRRSKKVENWHMAPRGAGAKLNPFRIFYDGGLTIIQWYDSCPSIRPKIKDTPRPIIPMAYFYVPMVAYITNASWWLWCLEKSGYVSCQDKKLFLASYHNWMHRCIKDWTQKWYPYLLTSKCAPCGNRKWPGIEHVCYGEWVLMGW